MTKPLTIDTAATWTGSLTTIQDGDPASEATMDVVVDSIGDHLGYLKTRAENSIPASLPVAVPYTLSGVSGSRVDVTVPFRFYSGVDVYSAALTVQSGAQVLFSGSSSLITSTGSKTTIHGAFGADFEILSDANGTLGWAFESRVPTLTAARTYTLPDPASISFAAGYARKRVVKVNSSAFGVNINDPVAGLIGTIDLGDHKGWIDFVFGPSNNTWRVSAWGGNVSFFSTML